MKVPVCRSSEVHAGGMKSVEVRGYPLLVANVMGRILVVGDVCTHARARLSDGQLDEDACTVECPLHGAKFSLETGEALEYPADEPLPTYPVALKDGVVHVELPDA